MTAPDNNLQDLRDSLELALDESLEGLSLSEIDSRAGHKIALLARSNPDADVYGLASLEVDMLRKLREALQPHLESQPGMLH